MKKTVEKKTVEIKTKEIADVICQHINQMRDADTGLFADTMGMITFLSYYSRKYPTQKIDYALDKLIDMAFERISKGAFYHTYCSGVAGTFYGFSFLQEKEFFNFDITEAKECYNDIITNSIIVDLANKNADFLHGAVGVAIYLLKYGSEKDLPVIIQLVDYLERTGVHDGDGIKWLSNMNPNDKDIFNICLSHGISSIAVFLTMLVKAEVEKERTEKLLNQTINFILSQEIDYQKYGCYFPYTSIEAEGDTIRKSRLAWCYGDLGVSLAIWEAGKALNKVEWQAKALEVFEFTATRQTLEDNLVKDAGICHGTAGIAQFFRRMYIETKNEKFLIANDFWINETLKMAQWNDGLAGYKAWQGMEPTWINDYSFLEGISGIGLVMLAYLGDEPDSDWDTFLLLS